RLLEPAHNGSLLHREPQLRHGDGGGHDYKIACAACTTCSALGMYAASSGGLNGTGVCGALTRWMGASSWSKHFSATIAAISDAIEQCGVDSSTTISRPVFSTERKMASWSRGYNVRGSMTSAS